MPTDVQEREHERGQLVPERQAREEDARRLTREMDPERRRALGLATDLVHPHERRCARQIAEKGTLLRRRGRVVDEAGDLDRPRQPAEMVRELFFERGVEHGVFLLPSFFLSLDLSDEVERRRERLLSL